jgi:hypothetical protein
LFGLLEVFDFKGATVFLTSSSLDFFSSSDVVVGVGFLSVFFGGALAGPTGFLIGPNFAGGFAFTSCTVGSLSTFLDSSTF